VRSPCFSGTYSRWRGDFSRAALAQSCAGSEAAAKTKSKLRAAKNLVADRLMLESLERAVIGRQGGGELFIAQAPARLPQPVGRG
jgi:hypothetical protein